MALRFPRIKTLLVVALTLVLLTMGVFVVLVETTRLPGDEAVTAGMVRDSAFYLTTRDSTRIAIDRWLPEDLEAGTTIPTLVRSTRYWRAAEVGALNRLMIRIGMAEAASTVDSEVDYFNRQGYAVLLVDARGTGASFGARDVEWGEEELRDLSEVVDWIVSRPWSNGRVGSWGVSYEANTAAMLAATQHPAVRAVAPQFADHDAWRDLVWPGGVFDVGMIGDWGAMVGALDRNDICFLAEVGGAECMMVQMAVPGVKPVDGSGGRGLLADAVDSHRTPDISAAARAAAYSDDPFGSAGVTFRDVSMQGRQRLMEEGGAAVFLWASWTDAGTQAGAVRMASSWNGDGPLDVLLGPWSHGAGHDTDPFREPGARPIPGGGEQMEMLTAFFDAWLKDTPAGDRQAADDGGTGSTAADRGGVRIRYRPLGMSPAEAGWWETDVWPPEGTTIQVLYGTADGRARAQAEARASVSDDGSVGTLGGTLSESPGAGGEVLAYRVDFSHSAGPDNRWHTQLGGFDVWYPDRASADSLLLTFDSEALAEELVLTGTPVLHLPLSVDRDDGAVHAYLEAVGPAGEVLYLTEGLLRLVHRGDGLSSPTFQRVDHRDVVPGERMAVRVEFQPIAAIIPAGYRVRLALGGADAGMFTRYPPDGELNWQVALGGTGGLRLELPVGSRPGDRPR